MKLFQITAAYKPAYVYGGPTMSVAKLCETLVSTAWNDESELIKSASDLQVFTTTANGDEELNVKLNELSEVDGVSVQYFKRLTKDHTHFSPALLLKLRSDIVHCIRNNEPVIIHIHAWWNLVSVLSCALGKYYKIPVLLSPRGMLTAYTTTRKNPLAKKILHHLLGKNLIKYCHIHATSEREKEDILKIIRPKTITVIANLVALQAANKNSTSLPCTPNIFSSQFNTDKQASPYKLIFLSRIDEKKGLELLFEALSKLEFEWTFSIAGSGSEVYTKRLKDKARHLKIDEKIVWLGQLNDQEKFARLAENDLFVLTSYNENFANVVVESLSVGTPVLLTEQVGLAAYVVKNNLGWVSARNIDGILSQINQSFSSIEKRLYIREQAPRLIAKDFSDKNLIKKYLELYESIK